LRTLLPQRLPPDDYGLAAFNSSPIQVPEQVKGDTRFYTNLARKVSQQARNRAE